MGELIIDLLQYIYHWGERKWRFWLYNNRGRKNSSFVDYGIALCYENEYEGHYNRDKNGRGEVYIDTGALYRIFSNAKGTYSIEYIGALCINEQWIDFAKAKCEESNIDYAFDAHYDNEGSIKINICCEIESDPNEQDARLYINGYIQETLEERRKILLRDFNEYKKNNQPRIEYNL